MFKDNDSGYIDFCDSDAYPQRWINDSRVDIVTFIIDVSNGMMHIHKQGVVHNDLKLGNIMFKNGRFLITDFGRSFLNKFRKAFEELKDHCQDKSSY
jgi:serine/threonine protein kinase